jgi:peptidylprolyl isomerase
MLMSAVKLGDRVRLHYTSYSHAGCVIETSQRREPLEFTAGSPEIIRGISLAVVGMRAGERKRVTLPPEYAFGERDAARQQVVPLSSLPERTQEGDQLAMTIGGRQLDVWVRAITGGEATVEANHPLVGETLVFDIELVGIGAGPSL